MFNDILSLIKLLFVKERELYVFYYRLLGFFPINIKYYKEALIHRSSSMQAKDGQRINNERLEYLGDAILDAIISDILYNSYKTKKEGFLTSTRAKIVQRETLNKIGQSLGLDKMILSSNNTQVHHKSYICGNALEALIAAIYLDRGYSVCKQFVSRKIIGGLLDLNLIVKEEQNYKSRLIEWAQKHKAPIVYSLINTIQDEENNTVFKSGVIIGNLFIADGLGYTKKESHQAASKEALNRINCDDMLRQRIFESISKDEDESVR